VSSCLFPAPQTHVILVVDIAGACRFANSEAIIDLIGETAGYIERLLMHYSPYSFGLFLAQIFCLVLSPVFFAGVNYILFSRIARNRMQTNSRAFRRTSYAFIASDILTFLIQSAGGSMFSSSDYNTIVRGGDVLVAGLALQLVSIVCFCIWMARSDYYILRYSRKLALEYEKEWNRIRTARWISIAGILVRSSQYTD
jgi:RTA1 like protein